MLTSRIRTVVLVMLAVLVLGSVGAAKTILRVQDWKINESETCQQWFMAAKERFEEMYPDVEIVYDGTGWGSWYVEKLHIGVATDTAPDVASVSIAWARDLFEAGVLLPLNDFIAKTPDLAPANFIPTTQLYNQKDGIFYGITNALDAEFIVYNMNHFDEAGLSTDPHAMETWDDFVSFGRKLVVRDSDGEIRRYGFDFRPTINVFSAFLDSNGGSIYNDTFTGLNIDTPEGRETLKFLHDIRVEYGFALDGMTSPYANFLNNTAAMGWGGFYSSYYVPQYVPGIRLGFTAIPKGPSGDKRGAMVFGNMYSITTSSKNPELAWKFIEWMGSLEAHLLHFEITETVQSARLDFYRSDLWLEKMWEHSWMQMIPEIAMCTGIYPFLQLETLDAVWPELVYEPARGNRPLDLNALSEVQRLVNAAFQQ